MLVGDIYSLDTQIDPTHMKQELAEKIRRFYRGKIRLPSFLINILEILVDNSVIRHQGAYYEAASGIATGVASGVLCANIYLSDYDSYIEDKLNSSCAYRAFMA